MGQSQSGEPAHVGVVRTALELMAADDLEHARQYWSPDFAYYGFDADGGHRESRGAEEFIEMFTGLRRLFERHEYEIVDLRGIGDELVVAHLITHDVARRTHVGHDAEYLMVLRVRAGRIHFACDFIDSSIQDFLDDAWSAVVPEDPESHV